MESVFERYRNLMVLTVILVAQAIGLAVQVRRGDSGHMTLDTRDGQGVRLIRLWANSIVSPPERFFHGIYASTAFIWNNYFDLRNVRQQNAQLQSTVGRLRLEEASLLEDARQGQRLQSMLGFQEKYVYQTQPAQIIGTSGSDQSRLFYIDKGSNSGIARDMAVITSDGIVGKIREVYPSSAQVLLINDQTSGAGVILESTRIRGVLRGNALGQPQIVNLTTDSRIQPGEKVLTAGGDEIFPRGLPVGTVDKVVKDPDQDGFIKVLVKPAAPLDRLDEVLVITSVQPRFSPQQKQDIATSETSKGAEVEEEKAQQKASEVMAEHLPGLLDPNLPADQQPLNDTSNPTPVSRPPMAMHPDRFTPDTNDNNGLTVPGAGGSDASPDAAPTSSGSKPASTSAKKPKTAAPKTPGGATPKPANNATPQGNQ